MEEKVPLRVTVLGVVLYCAIAWFGILFVGYPVVQQLVAWTSESMMLLARP